MLHFVTDYQKHPALRESFFKLARETFGINLKTWYEQGNWTDSYVPCSIAEDDQVVANVSVNHMNFLYHGMPKKAIQLGTVMTDPTYRRQGLSRRLIEKVLQEYSKQCDFIYLFANRTVLDFYPLFGFQRVSEFTHSKRFVRLPSPLSVRKLDLSRPDDKELLLHLTNDPLPVSSISMLDGQALLLFYLCSEYRDNLYLIGESVLAVAEYQGDTLFLTDLFSRRPFLFDQVVGALLTKDEMQVVFGFTPVNNAAYEIKEIMDDDEALFILPRVEWQNERFPVLSHT